jgi:hypothetical protein
MRRRSLPALPALVAGAGLALATAAPAQTPPSAAGVTFDRTCYSPGEAMTQTGHGFTPNAQVLELAALLAPNGGDPLRTLSASLTADASGAFAVRLRAPNLARASDRTEQAASVFTDQAAPAPAPGAEPPIGPTVLWTLSAWDVKVAQWSGGTADPRRSMVVDTYGWTSAGRTLYAHYYRGTTRIRSVRIGALTGPCGNLRKTVRQFPFRGVRAGQWRVFFSATAVLDKQRDDFIRRTIVVPRAKATA